jgi:Ala-tRNA(Pro) deacylase
MRVHDLLADHRVAFEALWHPPAYTAQKRAKYLRIPGSQLAKSVLLVGPRGCFVAVLPATHEVDTGRLAQDLGGPVRLAADAEIADVFRDCEWGVVPPFGRLYGLSTVLDDSLAPDAFIVIEGPTHAQALRLLCRDFERVEQPCRLRFARPAVSDHGRRQRQPPTSRRSSSE